MPSIPSVKVAKPTVELWKSELYAEAVSRSLSGKSKNNDVHKLGVVAKQFFLLHPKSRKKFLKWYGSQ